MSTKTTIKRIALVAVSALGLGMVSTVAAHAGTPTSTGGAWSATSGQVYSGAGTSAASQTVGNLAQFTYTETITAGASATAEFAGTFGTSGVGTITSVSVSPATSTSAGSTIAAAGAAITVPGSLVVPGTAAYPNPNASTGFGLAIYQSSAAATLYTVTVTAYSTAAGTQTLTRTTNAGTAITATLTWVGVSSVGLSATTSVMGMVATASSCASKTTPGVAADYVTGVLTAGTSDYYGNTTGSYDLCIYTFDANGNAIQPASITVIASKGFVGNSASPTSSSVSATPTATGAHVYTAGDGVQTGKGTFTAIITDSYGNSISLTRDFTWFGKMKSLVLGNNLYADSIDLSSGLSKNYYEADGTTVFSDANHDHHIYVRANDANGTRVKFSKWSTAAQNITTANLWVKSDNGNGNASTGKGMSNSWATVTVGASSDSNITSSSNGGLTVACAYGKYEKLTIVAYGYNSVTGLDDIASNAVTFYCSGAAASVVVTPKDAQVAAGGTTGVSVTVTDAKGYPVYDNMSVTFAGTGNGTVAPSTSSTVNGVAGTSDSTEIFFVGQNTNGTATVTAIAGGKSGSANIAVGSGVGDASSATDAANEATDAANAATDAANAAAEAADAATAAAQDAQAAVAALASQVADLIAGIKAQITSLTNLVIKIQKKVKA